MTADRAQLMTAFLSSAGWGDADIAPLAGDASQRRYLRLTRGTARAVLMDAPPERGEDVRPFVAVGHWLAANGFAAPETYAMDLDHGFLLIEDLGDNLYVRHIAEAPAEEEALYAEAIRLLVRLADYAPPARLGPQPSECALPPYDAATLLREASLIPEWWIPAATGLPTPPDRAAEYDALVNTAIEPVAGARDVVVLRDYHAENLLWLPDRAGLARVGLIDYQDALAGHPAYDLVSLLEDARRDTSPDLRAAMLDLYLRERPGLDAEAFRLAYASLGAQRNLKIVGIFARLARRDGKPQYLRLIPRVWAHLQRDLAHPALAPLADWVRAHVPEPTPATLNAIAAEVAA